ncbi:Eco57I restriction-modification methylase domain-containing protein [Mycolicibacterium tusciae]|uniref:Eco57I restriction-modification methylase domain-containing protein n=1 Tax=Mycolicibacterium tusciae TaxID=75922 RepID=UPI00024A16B8|nr:N-6 DNA methylase [Mycolicibacterium tusciae]
MSADTASTNFIGVRVVGGLLPADLLAKLVAGQTQDGLSSKDFHLAAGETVRDAANRVWAYLRGAWTTYRAALAALPDNDAATGLTRERFTLVLLDQLGYGRVHPTGKGGLHVGDRSFPISHVWGNVPIHLLGRVAVDTRTKGAAGAAGASPQSMVQELLNRSDDHLWAILANATTLRLVRDSTSLVGSAYVEFDLEAIFDGDLFADFLLLYSLCHVSRLEPRDPEVGPASCWMEHWRQDAIESGSRALNLLRDGVIEALHTLGSGFLTHPDNAKLRQVLADGEITVEEINHALLRVTYRLLFTFVAEDRNALLDPHAGPQARRRYLDYFSTERLRRTSRRRRGGRYGDRWEALKVVWRGLGSVDGLPELGLPGIGGLFDTGALDFLMECSLSNQALQSAVRSLSLVREPRSQAMRIVDYRNLGAEELGSIYESLLELMPSWDPATKIYSLTVASGNQRKDTGSYYTPTSLVESLLDTALDPVLDDAEKSGEPEQALLSVTVCDPACGSGHFLVGAARRIAKRVAALRSGDPEPAPEAVRSAMRDVVGRCIYGVDLNPLAAELAKVSLWLEALDPGRPLTFLDAQIRIGNALVGVTPRLLADGVPDEAFKPIEGDDKKITAGLAKKNKAERSAQGSLFDVDMVAANTRLAEQVEKVVAAPALSLADVHVQEQRLRAYTESTAYRQQLLAANAWCAAFVWPKSVGAPPAVTQRTITTLIDGSDKLTDKQRAEIERLTAEYRFFHWHLEFPHIFPTESTANDTVNETTGWCGGFSAVIGNPPWEHVELKEQEYFEARDPDIAKAAGAKRKRMITELLAGDSPVGRDYMAAKRRLDGVRHFAANSGIYPLCGRGRIKTDPLFAETGRALLAGEGRSGMILPTGIATDATTQYFFKDLVETGSISSLYDFENAKPLFEGVHRSYKFCLLTLVGRDFRESEADFAFFAHDPTDLERPGMRFALSPEEITLLNPNTGTCPVFRSRRDAEITLGIYRRVPVLIREGDPDGNPWGVKFMQGLFNMTSDSHLFRTRNELEGDGWTLRGNVFCKGKQEMLPLYEAKMVHHYDYRWSTFERDGTFRDVTPEEKRDTSFAVLPRYWVDKREVDAKLSGRWDRKWLLGFRNIARSTDIRTLIAASLPRAAVGHSMPLIASDADDVLQGAFTSYALDFVLRQKLGGTNLTFNYMQQLALPSPAVINGQSAWAGGPIREWIGDRVRSLNDGVAQPVRRQLLAELDAAFFHLYGLDREDVDYIMESFPIVKRKDISEFGDYRTKHAILEIYEVINESSVPYVSSLGQPSS